jgi:hypothetical protein
LRIALHVPLREIANWFNLPNLDGKLYTDDATRASAANDFGHLIRRYPKAVLKPGSV